MGIIRKGGLGEAERLRRRARIEARRLEEAALLPPGSGAEAARALELLALGLPEALRGRLRGEGAEEGEARRPWETPLGRQFLPAPRELELEAEALADPTGDGAYSPVKGIVHRHGDRLLLLPTVVCPVYCRFCFRRGRVGPRPGAAAALSAAELRRALAYIARQPGVWEVILSGGDPLMLSPRRLRGLVAGLAGIAHVRVLRLHSRVPLLAPGRVGAGLLEALQSRLPLTLCVHVNHVDEFSPRGEAALRRLAEGGLTLLGQTVLLRGVNDSVAALEALFRGQVERGIKPYYLHHCDLAAGVGGFRVSLERGLALMGALRGRVSGVCLPSYVLDIPGGWGKLPLEGGFLRPGADSGSWRIRDAQGREHALPRTLVEGAP